MSWTCWRLEPSAGGRLLGVIRAVARLPLPGLGDRPMPDPPCRWGGADPWLEPRIPCSLAVQTPSSGRLRNVPGRRSLCASPPQASRVGCANPVPGPFIGPGPSLSSRGPMGALRPPFGSFGPWNDRLGYPFASARPPRPCPFRGGRGCRRYVQIARHTPPPRCVVGSARHQPVGPRNPVPHRPDRRSRAQLGFLHARLLRSPARPDSNESERSRASR